MSDSTDNTIEPSGVVNDAQAKAARKRFLMIIACFGIPLILAIIWLQVVRSQGGTWGNTSRGQLIHPALPLQEFSLHQFVMKNPGKSAEEAVREPAEDFTIDGFKKIWSLVYLPQGECTEVCEQNFYHMRQVRLLLNNRMSRVQRVAVLQNPDQLSDKVLSGHLGLRVLSGAAADVEALRGQIRAAEAERKMNDMPDAIYVIDPFGNLMMRFAPDLDPGKMLKDLKHLLKVSRIG